MTSIPVTAAPDAGAVAIDRREPRADALLWALAAVILTSVWRVQDLFPVLGVVRPAMLTVGVALLLFALDRGARRRLAWLGSPVIGFLLAFVAILVIGAPVSIWPGGSIAFLVKDLLPSVALAVMIAAAVRAPRDVEWIMLASLLGAVLYCAVILLTVQVEASGRLGRLRFYDVNDLALLIDATIPFALYFARPGAARWRRGVALACLGVFLVTLVRTGSRGGFLAFLAVAAYTVLRYRALPPRARLASVVVGVLLIGALASDRYWAMMETILHPRSDYNTQTYDGRLALWRRGLGYIGEHPVLGVGAAAFPVAEGTISHESRWRHEMGLPMKWSVAHNSYIQTAAEGGLVALALFVLMGAAAFREAARVARAGRAGRLGDRRLGALAQTLTASLIGYALAGFFISAQYFAALYVLLGLVAGVGKLARWSAAAAPAGGGAR